jgi:SAM-dependent methyltransferase
MEPVEGAATFQASGDAYGNFMGRYSEQLAAPFVHWAGVAAPSRVLDVGCGPGALTATLTRRGAEVAACDPSPSFVTACTERFPGVTVRAGRAEDLPFDDAEFDAALAQLVLHFVSDPPAAAAEMRRVVRPGGVVAACVWDSGGGMELLDRFWEAAAALDPDAPIDAQRLRFGASGEMAGLFIDAGLADVVETTVTVTAAYRDLDELWPGFLAGVGPTGAYCTSLPADGRAALRDELNERIGRPSGPFSLSAVARCARGRVPSTTVRE